MHCPLLSRLSAPDPYTKSMIKAHNGMFLLNDTAAKDPAVQGAMASYMQQLAREAAYRKAVREGRVATSQSGNWHISDRD